MRVARRIVNSLPNGAIDKIFKMVIKRKLNLEFARVGDMDFQSRVLTAILKAATESLTKALRRYL